MAGLTSQRSDREPPAREEPAAPKQPVVTEPPPSPTPAESDTRYRVRAKQSGGPRSRSLIVRAISREHAEARALEELGADWEVLDVECV